MQRIKNQLSEIQLLYKARLKAKAVYKRNPTQKNLNRLKIAQNYVSAANADYFTKHNLKLEA